MSHEVSDVFEGWGRGEILRIFSVAVVSRRIGKEYKLGIRKRVN